MRLGQHSDEELVELAKAGWSPAFAVLAHRHAPMVRTALAGEDDPLSATTAVFVHAMRELRQRDAAAPVGPWLLELIDRPPPTAPATMSTEELDALWLELHRRWPDGERPATTWPWRGMALVAGLIVLAATVPAVVLGIGSTGDTDVELRAVPVTEDATTADLDEEEAPSEFSFPVADDSSPEDPGASSEPDAEPETETTPPPQQPETTEPAPQPAPEQPQQPDAETEPEADEPRTGSSSTSGPGDDEGDATAEDDDAGVVDSLLGDDEEGGEAAAADPS